MKKNVFDKVADSYEQFHLAESEINVGNDIIYISPKLKLILGWSIFVLCCVLAYIFVGRPVEQPKAANKEKNEAVQKAEVEESEKHDTIVPYEKDADEVLNAFIQKYFTAITECDNETLQDMVTEPSEYNSDENLKRKAEFITGYDNITVYTKAGQDEDSYVVFVVANLTIAGVNSSPYDIMTLYVVNGARGYLIHNGKITDDITAYIDKVKGDEDIQKVYQSIEESNNELKEKDASLQEFYDIINRKNVETNAAADGMNEEGSDDAE